MKAIERVKEEFSKVIVGQEEILEGILIALLTGGHLLIEGVPGLAKTAAIKTVANCLAADFKRIQFTPDLLPADLTGTAIYDHKTASFSVKKGPVFTNILLADEINRAPPKVQSALLEVMGERQVTIGGETFLMEEPFLVLATQNPLEQEGTYPLPEAQSDRFMMKLIMHYPSKEEERQILERMGRLSKLPVAKAVLPKEELLEMRKAVDQVVIDERLIDYILSIIFATRNRRELLQLGASPRASIALKLAAKARALLLGRDFVTPEDISKIAPAVLRHRVKESFDAEVDGLTLEESVKELIEGVPLP